MDATVFLEGVVEAAAMGLACSLGGIEAIVVCKYLPSLEDTRGGVD